MPTPQPSAAVPGQLANMAQLLLETRERLDRMAQLVS
jgi:hypothetical protein